MLKGLRKHGSSWLVKIVLAMIVASFVLFFGYSRVADRMQDERLLAAKVGVAEIPKRKYQRYYESAADRMREMMQGASLPEAFDAMIRKNILDQLIVKEATAQYAARLGFAVSDAEIAAVIRSDKNLSPEGRFDVDVYRERFLPYYRQNFGENFEDVVAQNILVEKFQMMEADLFGPWRDELSDSLRSLREASKKEAVTKKAAKKNVQTPEAQSETTGTEAETLSTDALFSLWVDDFKSRLNVEVFAP